MVVGQTIARPVISRCLQQPVGGLVAGWRAGWLTVTVRSLLSRPDCLHTMPLHPCPYARSHT